MQQHDLLALAELQELPILIDPAGQPFVPDLTPWSDAATRMEHRRHRHEAIAHSGMSPDELHLFFARASLTAAQGWNRDQSGWGRFKNMLTTTNIGFAQVPGRILKQAMHEFGDESGSVVVPSATYLMRADIALDFRDRLSELSEAST